MAGMSSAIGFPELRMEQAMTNTFRGNVGFLTPKEQQNHDHEAMSKGLKEKQA